MGFRIGILLSFYASAVAGICALLFMLMSHFIAHATLPVQHDFEVHILENDNIHGIANHLFENDCIHHTLFLKAVYVSKGGPEFLSPGMYRITSDMRYADLVEVLRGNKE